MHILYLYASFYQKKKKALEGANVLAVLLRYANEYVVYIFPILCLFLQFCLIKTYFISIN